VPLPLGLSHRNAHSSPAFQAGGLKAANSCNGVRLTRHTAVGNGGVGVWFDGGCRDVTVEDSLLMGNLVGVEYEISERARIRGNVVTGSELVGIYVSASNEVAVSNNTLDDNGYGVVVHGMPRGEHPALAGNTVQENIIGFSRRVDLVMYAGPGAADNTSDHNLFHRGDGSVRISWTRDRHFAVTHTDLRGFARDTGRDAASSTADPYGAIASATPPMRRLLEASRTTSNSKRPSDTARAYRSSVDNRRSVLPDSISAING